MSKSRGSPRKFAEKIALLNKKEAEGTSEFEKILKEVKESTRAPSQPQQYWGLTQRSASFSNWETFGPLAPEAQQQPQYHPQHNGSQYLSATQHVPYPSHPNQIQQARQHVINTTRQLPQQHQQQQQPQVHQSHHIAQVQQRLQPTIYVDHQSDTSNDYVHTTTTNGPQIVRRSSYVKPTTELTIQPISHEVPNIAIFPTDEDYQQELDVNSHTATNSVVAQNTLSDGRSYNNCSNSPISLSRSLPNIANLSVSPSTSNQIFTQPIVDQRLAPHGVNNDHLKSTTAPVTVATSTNSNNDCYLHDSSGTNHVNNDDYCSLPSFQQHVATINRQDPGRQSQSHIPLSDSWQQGPLSSAPSSAAPTPPGAAGTQGSPYGSQQHSPQQQQPMIHSPDSSPLRQQHSPQTLHQDYYPSPMQTQQNQLMRASSTNVMNKYPTSGGDLLETPRINGNLSKSTDNHYGAHYLENYATGEGFSSGPVNANGGDFSNNNMGGPYLTANNISSSPIARSRSENNIENIHSLNDYQFNNQYADTNPQQFLDTSQCQFYG